MRHCVNKKAAHARKLMEARCKSKCNQSISVQSMALCSSTRLWKRQSLGCRKVSISLGSPTRVEVDYSTILVRNGIIGIESDSFSKIVDCLVEVALTPVHNASIVVSGGIIWVEPDSLAVIDERLAEFFFMLIDGSTIIIGNGIVWFNSDGLAVISDSLI